MTNTRYWLVSQNGPAHGTLIVELTTGDYVVPVDEFNESPNMSDLRNAADNPGMTVIPLIEQLEWEDENLPTADDIERAGLDPRGGPYDWEALARTLMAERTQRVKLPRKVIKRLRKLQRKVDDESDTMVGARIVVDGVRLEVGDMRDTPFLGCG